MGCWNLFYVGYMLARSPESVAFFNSLIHACNSFSAAMFLLFTFEFTFPASKKNIKYFLIIPCLTTLFSMTYMFHGFMFSYDYVLTGEIMRVEEHFGPWHYVHIFFSYGFIISGIVFLLIKLKKKTSSNKKTVLLIITGSCFFFLESFIFNVFEGYTEKSVILEGISHLLCISVIYLGISSDNVSK